MIHPKVVIVVAHGTDARVIAEKHQFEHLSSVMPNGSALCAVYPRHHHTRFGLANEPGVTVLPGVHDPTPIGAAAAAALAHVNAKPTETMRTVALRLYDAHGAAFHPDS